MKAGKEEWSVMVQEAILESTAEPPRVEVNEALIICKECKHLVPRTMICLYCGAPILFKKPQGSSL